MRKAMTILLACFGFALGGALAAAATGIDLAPHAPPKTQAAGGSEATGPLPNSEPPVPARLPCTAADQRLNFSNSWAGQSFEGLPLTAVLRRCDRPVPGDPGRANYVSYIYGDCNPAGSDEGCAPPIEIQSWPAAEVTRQMFSTATPDGEPRPGTHISVEGMPATKYDGGAQLVIFGPQSTVMVFGRDPARVERFGTKSAGLHGPAVLTNLTRFGLEFDRSCAALKGYCPASRASQP
jgi:hypothetical protein